VDWTQKRAFIYNDHLVSEEVDEFHWEETFIRRGNAISYSRKESIIYLASTWNNYWHIGDVPDRDEVLQLTSVDKTPTKDEAKCNRERKKRIKTEPVYERNRAQAKCLAARRAKHPTASVKYWLTDTGCGYDLVSRKHVAKIADRVKKSNKPLTFQTANGATEAEDDILLRIDELDEEIEPFVMASTPAVLSIGRRCLDFGYEFRWPAGKLPYFITPKASRLHWLWRTTFRIFAPSSRLAR